MSKRRKSAVKPSEPRKSNDHPSIPWYRRLWFLGSLACAALIAILTNGPTWLANAEKLPGDFERVSSRFLSWYYEDDAWNGLWSAYPEGYVDGGDMKLSDVDIRLHLTSQQGRIGGEIATKTVCKAVPLFDYLLLEGKVSGDTATITAFDFIGGERQNFFRFKAKREGVVLTVSLVDGSPEWLPKEARIGLHPPREGEDPYVQLTGYCAAEREAFLQKLRSNKQ